VVCDIIKMESHYQKYPLTCGIEGTKVDPKKTHKDSKVSKIRIRCNKRACNMDIMGLERDKFSCQYNDQKIETHFKATDGWRRTLDTAINAPVEGVRTSRAGKVCQGICEYY